jgi:hypothetical protein
MPSQSWQQTLINSWVDGPALTASTTPTSLLHATAKWQSFPHYWKPGKMLKVTAQGRVSNIATTPGTLTLDLRVGPTSPPSIVICNGGAMALNTVAKTNVPWWMEWIITCRADGSGTSANVMHQGMWQSESVIGSPLPSAGGAGCFNIPATAPAVGTGFDSTVGLFGPDLFATWSLSNANSIQIHQFKIEDLNADKT